MRISRIYTSHLLSQGQTISLESEASRHLIQVLRLRPGANLMLFNGDGCNYQARLEAAEKKQARVKVISQSETEPENAIKIHLGISISKGERMDLAVQKSVELGVDEITPLFSKHSVVRLGGDRLEKRQQHWRKIIISACEQSGRCRIPVLHNAVDIDIWLGTSHQGMCLTLDPESKTSICSLKQPTDKINLLIGPEGGLSENEIIAAKNNGFEGICLGPRILRTETAPLAAIAAIQTLWGDFRT